MSVGTLGAGLEDMTRLRMNLNRSQMLDNSQGRSQATNMSLMNPEFGYQSIQKENKFDKEKVFVAKRKSELARL